MDDICRTLADKLCETGTGKFKIVYGDELMEALPEETRNRETLEAALKRLVSEGCVCVKYARGDAFCLAALRPFTTEKGDEQITKNPLPEEREQLSLSVPISVYISTAAAAFLGGAVGAAVAAIIRAVI